jgi:hypothetical protein
MVSSVNADENKVTVDFSGYVPICKHELFSKNATMQEMAESCFIAYFIKSDEAKNKTEVARLESEVARLEALDFIVKSCNYYRFSKYQNDICEQYKNYYKKNCVGCGLDFENCSGISLSCMIVERLK